jgi:hypothetical protein
MWIDRYEAEAFRHYEELRDSLTPKEVDELRTLCSTVELSELHRWSASNWLSVCEYVAATPSQRKRKKAWQDPEVKPLLVWAACRHAKRGCALLQGLMQSMVLSMRGAGYRKMTAEAGRAYFEVLSQDVPDWPFPGPDPFAGRG